MRAYHPKGGDSERGDGSSRRGPRAVRSRARDDLPRCGDVRPAAAADRRGAASGDRRLAGGDRRLGHAIGTGAARRAARAFASLIGVRAENVALMPSVSRRRRHRRRDADRAATRWSSPTTSSLRCCSRCWSPRSERGVTRAAGPVRSDWPSSIDAEHATGRVQPDPVAVGSRRGPGARSSRPPQRVGARTLVDATHAVPFVAIDAARDRLPGVRRLQAPAQSARRRVSARAPRALGRVPPLLANWRSASDPYGGYYGGTLDLAPTAARFDVSLAWFAWAGAAVSLEPARRVAATGRAARAGDAGAPPGRQLGLPEPVGSVVSVPVDDAEARPRTSWPRRHQGRRPSGQRAAVAPRLQHGRADRHRRGRRLGAFVSLSPSMTLAERLAPRARAGARSSSGDRKRHRLRVRLRPRSGDARPGRPAALDRRRPDHSSAKRRRPACRSSRAAPAPASLAARCQAMAGWSSALARMNRILEIDADNRCAVVQPGVINLDLSKVAEPYGLFFAPDPSSQKASTIGGNVANNAGGPHCLSLGVTVNHILGLEVVLHDGSVVRPGRQVAPTRPGLDLTGLLVGSEGTLGRRHRSDGAAAAAARSGAHDAGDVCVGRSGQRGGVTADRRAAWCRRRWR